MDIVEFLRARLDEPAPEVHSEECSVFSAPDLFFPCDCAWRGYWLREVEAKRRTLDRAVSVRQAFEDRSAGLWPDVSRREKHHAYQTLLDLALPYADHPDYQPEWKP